MPWRMDLYMVSSKQHLEIFKHRISNILQGIIYSALLFPCIFWLLSVFMTRWNQICLIIYEKVMNKEWGTACSSFDLVTSISPNKGLNLGLNRSLSVLLGVMKLPYSCKFSSSRKFPKLFKYLQYTHLQQQVTLRCTL